MNLGFLEELEDAVVIYDSSNDITTVKASAQRYGQTLEFNLLIPNLGPTPCKVNPGETTGIRGNCTRILINNIEWYFPDDGEIDNHGDAPVPELV